MYMEIFFGPSTLPSRNILAPSISFKDHNPIIYLVKSVAALLRKVFGLKLTQFLQYLFTGIKYQSHSTEGTCSVQLKSSSFHIVLVEREHLHM